MRRFATLWALLLAMALLAPRLALAHGSEHGTAAKHAAADRALLIPSCPGGQHGDFCTCGDPIGCSGSSPIVVAAPQLAVLMVVAASHVQPRREPPASGPPPPFSLRFSRAPPASS